MNQWIGRNCWIWSETGTFYTDLHNFSRQYIGSGAILGSRLIVNECNIPDFWTFLGLERENERSLLVMGIVEKLISWRSKTLHNVARAKRVANFLAKGPKSRLLLVLFSKQIRTQLTSQVSLYLVCGSLKLWIVTKVLQFTDFSSTHFYTGS